MKRYFLLPFHTTTLVLVATFTLGWVAVTHAGLAGIPLGLILLSWFFKYCFVLLDSIVAGNESPPVLSIEMVNPVDEQRPLAQAAIIVLAVLVVRAVLGYLGRPAALVIGSMLVFELPASVAVLAMTSNPLRAVWPPELWSITRVCGREYLLVNIAMFAAAMLLYGLGQLGLPFWFETATGQLWFLLAFSLVGGALFEHRIELGIDSRTRQEWEAERKEREHVLERNRMLDRAYASFRVSKPLEGWQEIESWLERCAPGDRRPQELAALLQSTSAWDDGRAADRLASELIGTLLAKKENGKALQVLEQRLLSNSGFRPPQPAHLARLGSSPPRPASRRCGACSNPTHFAQNESMIVTPADASRSMQGSALTACASDILRPMRLAGFSSPVRIIASSAG